MAITQAPGRIRVESAAKDGTLLAQGVLGLNQILMDTGIAINNGNLVSSPGFENRHVLLRRGQANTESNIVKSVNVDGLTCTMVDDWDVAPSIGDNYEVSYNLDDLTGFAGCSLENDSRQYVMNRKLVIGDGTNFAYLGMSFADQLRLSDEGATDEGLRIVSSGRMEIGTIKDDKPARGGILIFTHDVDEQICWRILSGGVLRIYNAVVIGAYRPFGNIILKVDFQAGSNIVSRNVETFGVGIPRFRRVQERFATQDTGAYLGTVADIKASPEYTGYAGASYIRTLQNLLVGEADDAKVRILIEDA